MCIAVAGNQMTEKENVWETVKNVSILEYKSLDPLVMLRDC